MLLLDIDIAGSCNVTDGLPDDNSADSLLDDDAPMLSSSKYSSLSSSSPLICGTAAALTSLATLVTASAVAPFEKSFNSKRSVYKNNNKNK